MHACTHAKVWRWSSSNRTKSNLGDILLASWQKRHEQHRTSIKLKQGSLEKERRDKYNDPKTNLRIIYTTTNLERHFSLSIYACTCVCVWKEKIHTYILYIWTGGIYFQPKFSRWPACSPRSTSACATPPVRDELRTPSKHLAMQCLGSPGPAGFSDHNVVQDPLPS